jgi:hypothetical protein
MELQRKHSDVSERSAYSIHPRCSREFFRTQSSFLEAASDALADGRSEDSLELLERARSLFWAQALVTHTSIDGGLTIEERMSAYRFLTAGFDDAAQVALDARLHDMDTFVAESATRLHKCVLISKNYAAQISAHKDIPPFSFPALVHAAGGKTIVYLVCARTRCDAVVIKPSGIAQHIPLPGASPALLSRIVQGIKSQSAGNRSQRKSQLDQARAIRLRTGPIQDDSYSVDAGLATLWREVLEPIISGLALKVGTNLLDGTCRISDISIETHWSRPTSYYLDPYRHIRFYPCTRCRNPPWTGTGQLLRLLCVFVLEHHPQSRGGPSKLGSDSDN